MAFDHSSVFVCETVGENHDYIDDPTDRITTKSAKPDQTSPRLTNVETMDSKITQKNTKNEEQRPAM